MTKTIKTWKQSKSILIWNFRCEAFDTEKAVIMIMNTRWKDWFIKKVEKELTLEWLDEC